MPHILKAEQIAKANIDFTDAMSQVEANLAASKYSTTSTPTLAAVNAAKDTMMDWVNDAATDFEGNVASFKTACLIGDE